VSGYEQASEPLAVEGERTRNLSVSASFVSPPPESLAGGFCVYGIFGVVKRYKGLRRENPVIDGARINGEFRLDRQEGAPVA